jgi:hypothetical protein
LEEGESVLVKSEIGEYHLSLQRIVMSVFVNTEVEELSRWRKVKGRER